jgi:hypothetical protein
MDVCRVECSRSIEDCMSTDYLASFLEPEKLREIKPISCAWRCFFFSNFFLVLALVLADAICVLTTI